MIPIKVDFKIILSFLELDDHVKFPNDSHNVPLNSQWVFKMFPKMFSRIKNSKCNDFL
jgi:hypothetical protein